MAITTSEFEKLSMPVAGKRRDDAPPMPENPADMEAFITGATPKPVAKKVRDHFDAGPMTREEFVDIVKRVHPEAAEFTLKEIGDYAQYYMEDTFAFCMKQVGLHMRDRLEKRGAGQPHFDDSIGLAAMAAAAESG